MVGVSTKERIVEVAVGLFNDKGTGAVSTNHIAEAAAISPGNLYYHYRNKQEIILAAYKQALIAYDDVWERAGTAEPTPETMYRLLQDTFGTQWRYRFLQRELPALVRRDEALRRLYRETQERRLAFYRRLVAGWVASGLTEPIDDRRLDDLVTASWVVGDQWVTYLESMGCAGDETEVRRGARLVLEVFRPHFTAEVALRLESLGR